MDNQRRREYSLKFTIESISNVTSKKRYHCELMLNSRIYARTSSRLAEKGEAAWNEIYELCNLSPITTVTINLYKEMTEGKGDKKRYIRQKIAFATIHIEELYDRHEVKKKLTMQKSPDDSLQQSYGRNFCVPSDQKQVRGRLPYHDDSSDCDMTRGEYLSSSLPRDNCTGSTRSGIMRYLRSRKDVDVPVVSISAKYQCIEILPLSSYHHLNEFLLHNHDGIVKYLDEKLTGRRLDEVSSSLVAIHELAGNVPKFITESICTHVESVGDASQVILRSNSIGSKAIECYMKLVGMDYLKIILEDFALKILLYPSSLEVDTSRLEDKSFLKLTQVQLCSMVHSLWQNIFSSVDIFPRELKKVFVTLRRSLDQMKRSELADQLLSSCLFLRFICPAILNPYLYQLIQEYPQDPRIIRNFTLISKSLQTLANQTSVVNEGPILKEIYMIPIHESLSKERTKMISFLRQISTESLLERAILPEIHKCHEYIDMGYELSVSHLYLSEVFLSGECDQKLPQDLHSLVGILECISAQLCSSTDSTTTTGMAEMLSKSCKLLADNVKDQFTSDQTAISTHSATSGSSSIPTSQHIHSNNIYGSTSRKTSAPPVIDKGCYVNDDTAMVHMKYLNTDQVNSMWKTLVERAEQHINGLSDQPPQMDIDLDPDFQMKYQFYFNPGSDISQVELEAKSLSSSAQTPTSQNLTIDTSLSGNIHLSYDESLSNVHCPPPTSIQTRPSDFPTPLKSSPTKSIRMGTKAIMTILHKKPQNELETMKKLVTEAEFKFLQAKKEIEEKEEENRKLRKLLQNRSEIYNKDTETGS